MKVRRRRPSKHNDAIVLATIENRLRQHAIGNVEMSPTQVMAARAVYDKLRPTLAAVEHTEPDARDAMRPDELVTRLAAMFDAKPELWQQVLALRQQSTAANDQTSSTELEQKSVAA